MAGEHELTIPSQEISFDDMGEQLARLEEANRTKLEDVKVDGEDVPESLRGKSARELVNYAKQLEQAVKTSESARQEALILAQTASRQPVAAASAAPTTQAEPELTRDQIKELYDTDPLAAIEAMQQQAFRKAELHLQQRLEPLIGGASSSAEQTVRAKYPEEFEVLGPEIKAMVDSLPDKRVLSQPGNWEQLVKYVRGEHMDKMFEHRVSKSQANGAQEARRQQQEVAGFHTPADQRPVPNSAATLTSPTGKKVVWDDYAQEVAKTLGMTKDEYIKWSL